MGVCRSLHEWNSWPTFNTGVHLALKVGMQFHAYKSCGLQQEKIWRSNNITLDKYITFISRWARNIHPWGTFACRCFHPTTNQAWGCQKSGTPSNLKAPTVTTSRIPLWECVQEKITQIDDICHLVWAKRNNLDPIYSITKRVLWRKKNGEAYLLESELLKRETSSLGPLLDQISPMGSPLDSSHIKSVIHAFGFLYIVYS